MTNVVELPSKTTEQRMHCSACDSDAFIVIYDKGTEGYPTLYCAECRSCGGDFGWLHTEVLQ
jgi:hypothetical protein